MKNLCLLALLPLLVHAEAIGKRPYEMDWAKRFEDEYPVVEDFEAGWPWAMETNKSTAVFTQSSEQQLYGKYVGKLVYHGEPGAEIIMRPTRKISLKPPVDTVGCWIYGNNWGWARDKQTPQVNVYLLFRQDAGNEMAIFLSRVNWEEWFHALVHLDVQQQAFINQPGTVFSGIKITGGSNAQNRVLYFDSVCAFKEVQKPLSFKSRPARGIDMFPGQDCGANTGPGRLPFPTREDTILPDSAATGSHNETRQSGQVFELSYHGSDGNLVYRYKPLTGSWDDITAIWNNRQPLKLLTGGGVRFPSDSGGHGLPPETAKHLGTVLQDGKITSHWHYQLGKQSMEATYTLQIRGKTLVLDTHVPDGVLGAVEYGGISGLENPRKLYVPYYAFTPGRPGVILGGTAENPLFYSAHTDWYRSNASSLWGRCDIADNGIAYANGGVQYTPKTNGARNPCFERFFITLGPKFEEHLPNIPNPPSPYKAVMADRIWKEYGATRNREADKAYWRNTWRHGMRKMLVVDHESCWRDNGESFTFRTKAAPAKGGDEGMLDYATFMQRDLGFLYGPYNNFTDFAPVNEHWRSDIVARGSNGEYQHAWMRCYAPKPQYAVEYCDELTPIIQDKFHFSAIYCDVHTCVSPWSRCDYDWRVPGAGTFAATFYAYGELLLKQKQSVNGPVYSEGAHHFMYAGLTDGNYAQDLGYELALNPWLVDFELRKIHDLETGVGVGKFRMIYGSDEHSHGCPKDEDEAVDRFLAVSMAFGHQGYYVTRGNFRRTLRSYYLFQQLQSRYTVSSVDTIRYADQQGRWWNTTDALVNNAYKMSQVAVRYQDGTHVAVNGNYTERLRTQVAGRKLDLPANGYCGWTEDGKIFVFSGDRNGAKADYAESPEYIYIDGRDNQFQRFPKAASEGAGICRFEDADHCEIIPIDGAECGFSLPKVLSAVCLDKDMKELGPAVVRTARGLTYVHPVKGAFSYRLTLSGEAAAPDLQCEQDVVFPGERVTVHGPQGPRNITIPDTTDKRVWLQIDGQWIDFTLGVMGKVTSCQTQGDTVTMQFTTPRRLPNDELSIAFEGQRKNCRLSADEPHTGTVQFKIPLGRDFSVRYSSLEMSNSQLSLTQTATLTILESLEPYVLTQPFDKPAAVGYCLRNQREISSLGTSGAAVRYGEQTCGRVVKKGYFIHPPYQGGVGYTFAIFDMQLPQDMPLQFKAQVGIHDCRVLGDGIWLKVLVDNQDMQETLVAEDTVKAFKWQPLSADLTRWAGQKIRLKCISDVGPADDSTADWSAWADLRLESRDVFPHRQILLPNHELKPLELHPDYVAGLSIKQLRSAKRGWFCYEGIGLNSTPENMPSYATLNNVPLGVMAEAGGNEANRIWAPERRIPLPAEALQSLRQNNRLDWTNPRGDCMKVRRFRLLLELADGRIVSSKVVPTVFAMPPSWKYSEGVMLAPPGPITVPLDF